MTGAPGNDRISLPKTAGRLWLRAFLTLLFVFRVNYVPCHLAAEVHLDDLPASLHVTESHTEFAIAADDGHGDNHLPHLAADHSLKLTPQTQLGVGAQDVVAADPRVPLPRSQPSFRLFLTERQNPPGRFTAGPFRPRAPPPA